jgi:dihydroneopterin aldolase
MMAKIHLNQLKVETLLGVRHDERKQKQPVIIDLVLEIDPHPIESSDDLASTINYREVASFVEHLVSQAECYLLERLTIHLVKNLLKNFPFLSVYAKIQKPLALKGIAEVSFEYFHRG